MIAIWFETLDDERCTILSYCSLSIISHCPYLIVFEHEFGMISIYVKGMAHKLDNYTVVSIEANLGYTVVEFQRPCNPLNFVLKHDDCYLHCVDHSIRKVVI